MALYFITGVSGAGKSTLLHELNSRQYKAYDVDEAGPVTAKWQNNVTGFIHPKSSVKAADRTEDFLAEHSWKISREEVESLKNIAQTETVFFGGNVANESEFTDLCDEVFSLKIDDETMMQRLRDRTDNNWGKSDHEAELSIKQNRTVSKKHQILGYVTIDASQSIKLIANDIEKYLDDK